MNTSLSFVRRMGERVIFDPLRREKFSSFSSYVGEGAERIRAPRSPTDGKGKPPSGSSV